MNSVPFYFLIASMVLNFIIIAYQLNKKQSAIVVSLSGISIVLQAMVMRYIAVSPN